MTIYTVMIAYVLPLLTIIFCYIRMILKLLRKSKNSYLLEEIIGSSLTSQSSQKMTKIDHAGSRKTKSIRTKSMCSKKRGNDGLYKNDQLYSSVANIDNQGQSSADRKIKKKTNNVLMAKRQRIKLLFLIATVAITFATTWLPAHVIQIWKVVFNEHFPYNDTMYIIKVISHTLSYSNSFLNPIIYVFIGAKFRNYISLEFNNIGKCLCLRSRADREMRLTGNGHLAVNMARQT